MKKWLALLGILLIVAGITEAVATRHHKSRKGHRGTTTQNDPRADPPTIRGLVLTFWNHSDPNSLPAQLTQIAATGANWIEIPIELRDSSNLDVAALAEASHLAHQHALNVCLEFRLPPAERNNLPTDEAEQDQWIQQVWGPRVLAAVQAVGPLQIDMICLADRLGDVQERAQAWIALIDAVRKNYKGSLTYAAAANDYAYVTWWSSLDYIGVLGDFSLSDDTDPESHAVDSAWDAQLSTLQSISECYGKPALLLDVGYSANPQVAHNPRLMDRPGAARPDIQDMCYQSALEATGGKPWLAGIFVKPAPTAQSLSKKIP